MSKLTKAEKIALAEAEVKQANNMVEHSRKELERWLGVLEVREEYLESIKS